MLPTPILTYSDRVRAVLGDLPQEIRFIAHHDSTARVFESIGDASTFLENPDLDFAAPVESYVYQITYSDGSEFERAVQTLDELRALHVQTDRLASHMRGISKWFCDCRRPLVNGCDTIRLMLIPKTK